MRENPSPLARRRRQRAHPTYARMLDGARFRLSAHFVAVKKILKHDVHASKHNGVLGHCLGIEGTPE